MIPRYSHPEMAAVWSEDNTMATWLKVELAVCEAWAELGVIPPEALEEIRRATFDPARFQTLLEEVHHDTTAFVRTISESVGEAGRFLDLGLPASGVADDPLA